MSKPQNKSSQAQKSTAKVSQSSSKAHEVLENLLADNAAQKEHIKLLEEANQRFSYTIGGRDLEIFDLREQVTDLEKEITAFNGALQYLGKLNVRLAEENQRSAAAYNQLGRDYANLYALNNDLSAQIKNLGGENGVLSQQNSTLRAQVAKQTKQQETITKLKQMLSLQQQIMSDVGGQ